VRDARAMGAAEAAAAVDAFYLIQQLRLQAQVLRPDGEREAANQIAPSDLNRLAQSSLKEALRIARDMQKRLSLDYQL